MIKKNIITIAGRLGSGKSSTAKKIAHALNYTHLSSGDFMRDIAQKRGVSLMELNKIAERDDSIDRELDKRNLEIGDKTNIVIDSRMGFYFIPNSFKVFLELPIELAAERILKDKDNNPNRQTEDSSPFNLKEDIIKSIKNRAESEKKRYYDLYNIEDATSPEYFDLIIDSSKFTLEEVSQKILKEYEEWLRKI